MTSPWQPHPHRVNDTAVVQTLTQWQQDQQQEQQQQKTSEQHQDNQLLQQHGLLSDYNHHFHHQQQQHHHRQQQQQHLLTQLQQHHADPALQQQQLRQSFDHHHQQQQQLRQQQQQQSLPQQLEANENLQYSKENHGTQPKVLFSLSPSHQHDQPQTQLLSNHNAQTTHDSLALTSKETAAPTNPFQGLLSAQTSDATALREFDYFQVQQQRQERQQRTRRRKDAKKSTSNSDRKATPQRQRNLTEDKRDTRAPSGQRKSVRALSSGKDEVILSPSLPHSDNKSVMTDSEARDTENRSSLLNRAHASKTSSTSRDKMKRLAKADASPAAHRNSPSRQHLPSPSANLRLPSQGRSPRNATRRLSEATVLNTPPASFTRTYMHSDKREATQSSSPCSSKLHKAGVQTGSSPSPRYPRSPLARDAEAERLEELILSKLSLTGRNFVLAIANVSLQEKLVRHIEALGGSADHSQVDGGVYAVLTDLRLDPDLHFWCVDITDPATVLSVLGRYRGPKVYIKGVGGGRKEEKDETGESRVDTSEKAPRLQSKMAPTANKPPVLPLSRGREMLNAAQQRQSAATLPPPPSPSPAPPQISTQSSVPLPPPPPAPHNHVVTAANPTASANTEPANFVQTSEKQGDGDLYRLAEVPEALAQYLTGEEYRACLQATQVEGEKLRLADLLGLEILDASAFLEVEMVTAQCSEVVKLTEKLGERRTRRLYARVREENKKIAIRVEHVHQRYKPIYKSFRDYPRDQLRIPIVPLGVLIPAHHPHKCLQQHQQQVQPITAAPKEGGEDAPTYKKKNAVQAPSQDVPARGREQEPCRTNVDNVPQKDPREPDLKESHDALAVHDIAKEERFPEDSEANKRNGLLACDAKGDMAQGQVKPRGGLKKSDEFRPGHVLSEQHQQGQGEGPAACTDLQPSRDVAGQISLEPAASVAVGATAFSTTADPTKHESPRVGSRRRLFDQEGNTQTNQNSATDTALHKSSFLDCKTGRISA